MHCANFIYHRSLVYRPSQNTCHDISESDVRIEIEVLPIDYVGAGILESGRLNELNG